MRAVFVQLILVCQPHCTSHPQHRATDRVECNWPPDIRRFGGTIAQGEHRQIDGICAALQHINAAYSTHKKPHADINPLIKQTFVTYEAIFTLEKPIPLSFFPFIPPHMCIAMGKTKTYHIHCAMSRQHRPDRVYQWHPPRLFHKTKAYKTYIVPQAAYCSCSGAFVSQIEYSLSAVG